MSITCFRRESPEGNNIQGIPKTIAVDRFLVAMIRVYQNTCLSICYDTLDPHGRVCLCDMGHYARGG